MEPLDDEKYIAELKKKYLMLGVDFEAIKKQRDEEISMKRGMEVRKMLKLLGQIGDSIGYANNKNTMTDGNDLLGNRLERTFVLIDDDMADTIDYLIRDLDSIRKMAKGAELNGELAHFPVYSGKKTGSKTAPFVVEQTDAYWSDAFNALLEPNDDGNFHQRGSEMQVYSIEQISDAISMVYEGSEKTPVYEKEVKKEKDIPLYQ